MADTTETAIDKAGLTRFEHQVAGHGGIVHTSDKAVLMKSLNARENLFYKGAADQPLRAFLPAYHGTARLDNDEAPDAAVAAGDTHICLENLAADYTSPCILDIKMGTQLHDLDATPEKKARAEAHAKRRTSAEIGYALSGYVIAGHPAKERSWLYDLTKQTVVTEALVPFFDAAQAAVDAEYRDAVVGQIVDWLVEYRDAVRAAETRMFGSSLLVIVEADGLRAVARRRDGQRLATVRAIDFAHSHWTPGQGPDSQYLFGLDNLIRTLQDMLPDK
ncbi:hypothetical protein LPJ56_002523 [Coemansia sp. RSA 2599]|nr:hypothetical protein LPJ56_002523 [Coemansia sp. RSA 2599]